mmetsp:Transcript_19985/g.64912  ORF Transcript_19985/g.64912 Transcript_19985/m.64912 type:complete len:248 (+) Transcript_19985:2808-3551(+)
MHGREVGPALPARKGGLPYFGAQGAKVLADHLPHQRHLRRPEPRLLVPAHGGFRRGGGLHRAGCLSLPAGLAPPRTVPLVHGGASRWPLSSTRASAVAFIPAMRLGRALDACAAARLRFMAAAQACSSGRPQAAAPIYRGLGRGVHLHTPVRAPRDTPVAAPRLLPLAERTAAMAASRTGQCGCLATAPFWRAGAPEANGDASASGEVVDASQSAAQHTHTQRERERREPDIPCVLYVSSRRGAPGR